MGNRVLASALVGALTAVVFCAVSTPGLGQGSFDLKQQEFKGAADPLARAGMQWVSRLKEKPSDLKGVPEGLGDTAAYFQARPAGLDVILAVEPSDPARLYVDTDLDRDLSDEKAITALGIEERMTLFGAVTVKNPEDKDAPGAEFAVGSMIQSGTAHYVYVAPAGFRSGEARLGGVAYGVAIVDASLDGQFGPLPQGQPGRSDYFVMDFNHDGQFGYDEIMPPVKMVRASDSYYGVEIEPDGSAIRFEKVTPKLGTLDVGSPQVEVSVISAEDTFRFRLEPSADGAWKLPVGTYRIAAMRLHAVDEKGVEWTVVSLRPPQKVASFTIREGETTSIELGPPLDLATNVQGKDKQLSVSLTLTGRSGETYLPGASNAGKQLSAPTLKILDEKGNELASGSFQYG